MNIARRGMFRGGLTAIGCGVFETTRATGED